MLFRITAWKNNPTNEGARIMTTHGKQARLDRRDEIILMIIALVVPLAALPAMMGI